MLKYNHRIGTIILLKFSIEKYCIFGQFTSNLDDIAMVVN